MSHLLANYPNITSLKHISAEILNGGRTRLFGCREIWRSNAFYNEKGKALVQCCSGTSTSTSTSISPSSSEQVGLNRGINNGEQLKLENLFCDYGWRVRRLVEKGDEMRKVAQVQAEAFHVPVALFNDLFFEFFQAEVLSGLLYKLRNSPPNRYACLVAEPAIDDSDLEQEVVGVVDVTVLRDDNVLQHLPSEAEEYLYISGIAVSESFRRRKVATALLKACEVLSLVWGFEYLALRAYEEDWGARKLYSNAGYQIVSKDSPLFSTWIGRKRRVLMIKQTNMDK